MSSRDVTLAVWSLIGTLAVLLLVLSAFRPASWPTLGRAVSSLAASPYRRAVLVLGWMWLGWHLFAR